MGDEMLLKDQILTEIQVRPKTSFVDLEKIKGFEGVYLFCHHQNKNMVLWDKISEPAVRALSQLMREKKIHTQPCSPNHYLLDGKTLDFPIAETGKEQIKSWLPIVFVETK